MISTSGDPMESGAIPDASNPRLGPSEPSNPNKTLTKGTPEGRSPFVIKPLRGFDFSFRELWAYRELLYFLIWRDVKIRYKQTILGGMWALIQPLMMMAVFTIFFGRLAGIPTQGLPKPLFYLAGLVPWIYFANALANCTNTLVENQRVITKVYFPRVLLPISAVAGGLVDLALSMVMLVATLFIFDIDLHIRILTIPLFGLLAVTTALAIGLWLSALNALFRDVRYVIPFLIQFWLFASPVAYPTSLLDSRWVPWFSLNPMVGVIDGFRWGLTGVGAAPETSILISVILVIAITFSGLIFFQKVEATVADVV